jgi:hypothetical protein
VVHAELAGNRAHRPLLDVVEPQDHRLEFATDHDDLLPAWASGPVETLEGVQGAAAEATCVPPGHGGLVIWRRAAARLALIGVPPGPGRGHRDARGLHGLDRERFSLGRRGSGTMMRHAPLPNPVGAVTPGVALAPRPPALEAAARPAHRPAAGLAGAHPAAVALASIAGAADAHLDAAPSTEKQPVRLGNRSPSHRRNGREPTAGRYWLRIRSTFFWRNVSTGGPGGSTPGAPPSSGVAPFYRRGARTPPVQCSRLPSGCPGRRGRGVLSGLRLRLRPLRTPSHLRRVEDPSPATTPYSGGSS